MNKIEPRKDYITWDDYFMGIALLSAMRSKDPSSQVGACIVSDEKRILSIGYNGTTRGIEDDDFNWAREGEFVDTKYARVMHAEPNAILNYPGDTKSLRGATIYVTLFPCNECAKFLAQIGLGEVVYLSDKYKETDGVKVSKEILSAAGINYRQYESEHVKNNKIEIDFTKPEGMERK
jgi:dCMP deaminase